MIRLVLTCSACPEPRDLDRAADLRRAGCDITEEAVEVSLKTSADRRACPTCGRLYPGKVPPNTWIDHVLFGLINVLALVFVGEGIWIVMKSAGLLP